MKKRIKNTLTTVSSFHVILSYYSSLGLILKSRDNAKGAMMRNEILSLSYIERCSEARDLFCSHGNTRICITAKQY